MAIHSKFSEQFLAICLFFSMSVSSCSCIFWKTGEFRFRLKQTYRVTSYTICNFKYQLSKDREEFSFGVKSVHVNLRSCNLLLEIYKLRNAFPLKER